jgi:hypothetical protein
VDGCSGHTASLEESASGALSGPAIALAANRHFVPTTHTHAPHQTAPLFDNLRCMRLCDLLTKTEQVAVRNRCERIDGRREMESRYEKRPDRSKHAAQHDQSSRLRYGTVESRGWSRVACIDGRESSLWLPV